MSDNEQVTPALPTPQQELQEAQARLGAAKARLEAADKLRLQTLQAKVAAIQAEKDRQAAEERARQEALDQAWVERKNKEREEEQRLQREEAAKNAALQAEIAKAEAALQEQRKREALLQQIAAETQALEQAAQAAQAAALADLDFIESGVETRVITPSAEEDATGLKHPLGRFQQRTDIYAKDMPVPEKQEISSEVQSKTQARLDAIAEGVVPTYAQSPTPVPVAVEEPRRKPQRYVDASVSKTLETLLWNDLKLRGNPNAIDNLSATFTEVCLMAAAHKTVAQFKAQPMSWDMLIQTINDLCDAPATPEAKQEPEASDVKA